MLLSAQPLNPAACVCLLADSPKLAGSFPPDPGALPFAEVFFFYFFCSWESREALVAGGKQTTAAGSDPGRPT